MKYLMLIDSPPHVQAIMKNETTRAGDMAYIALNMCFAALHTTCFYCLDDYSITQQTSKRQYHVFYLSFAIAS